MVSRLLIRTRTRWRRSGRDGRTPLDGLSPRGSTGRLCSWWPHSGSSTSWPSHSSTAAAPVDTEAAVAALVEDGQQLKSSTKFVSNVLLSFSLFLCNVGLQSASKKSSTTSVSVKVQQLQD